MNKKNNNTIKQEDFALFNLEFMKNKYAYKIKIIKVSDSHIESIFKNDFKMDNMLLDLDPDGKNSAFQIKETIKCEIKKLKNGNLIGKNQNDYVKIKGPKYKYYYLKFSIDARISNQLYLSVAFAVYEYYYQSLYIAFRASKTKNPEQLKKPLNEVSNEEMKNINSINNYQNQYFHDTKVDANIRSKSLNNSSFHFNKKANEILEQEQKYLYSDIKNIPNLTKSICTKIFGLENLGNTCFLNSSLQILIHSPIFIEKFLEDISLLKPNSDTIAFEFFNFIMNVAFKNKKLFSPKKIISIFTKKSDMFSLGQQSDSQRFYRNFLTILEKELGPNNTCIKNSFLGIIDYSMENRCSNPICEYAKFDVNTSQQPFYDIFLSVPENESTIEDLIYLTYRPQIIKLKKKCKCGAFLEVIRSTAIKPNLYFNMNIQRGKIATRNLKNTKIVVDNLYRGMNYFYEPYAINFHVGAAMDFGHYYR